MRRRLSTSILNRPGVTGVRRALKLTVSMRGGRSFTSRFRPWLPVTLVFLREREIEAPQNFQAQKQQIPATTINFFNTFVIAPLTTTQPGLRLGLLPHFTGPRPIEKRMIATQHRSVAAIRVENINTVSIAIKKLFSTTAGGSSLVWHTMYKKWIKQRLATQGEKRAAFLLTRFKQIGYTPIRWLSLLSLPATVKQYWRAYVKGNTPTATVDMPDLQKAFNHSINANYSFAEVPQRRVKNSNATQATMSQRRWPQRESDRIYRAASKLPPPDILGKHAFGTVTNTPPSSFGRRSRLPIAAPREHSRPAPVAAVYRRQRQTATAAARQQAPPAKPDRQQISRAEIARLSKEVVREIKKQQRVELERRGLL